MNAQAVPGNLRPTAWRKTYGGDTVAALRFLAAHPQVTRGRSRSLRPGDCTRIADDPEGPSYRITTDWQPSPEAGVAVVQSYADVLREYRLHPEAKILGPDGHPYARATRGVLGRRPVQGVGRPILIGKEANRLEDVQNGLVAGMDEVLTTYINPSLDILPDLVLPVLDRFSGRELARMVGCDRRQIDRIRRGQRPREELFTRLIRFAGQTAAYELGMDQGVKPADSSLIQILAAWKAVQSDGRRRPACPRLTLVSFPAPVRA